MNEATEALVMRDQPMELSVPEVLDQIRKIQSLMKEGMQKGEHYGVIPGCQKPTLLKPGAEKLCLMFRLDPEPEIIKAIQEKDFISYTVKCSLYHIPTGRRIAAGIGSCNSREAKYRYRQQNRKCPKCGKETIIKGKDEFGGGWLCFKKKGGCGASWKDGAEVIESQQAGQIENENPWDLDNTLLKMANKRALVAATLNGTAASDIFTQDIEEMSESADKRPPSDEAPPIESDNIPPPANAKRINQGQVKRMYAIGGDAGRDNDDIHVILKDFGFESAKDVLASKYEEICEALSRNMREQPKEAPDEKALKSKRLLLVDLMNNSCFTDEQRRKTFDLAEKCGVNDLNVLIANAEKKIHEHIDTENIPF